MLAKLARGRAAQTLMLLLAALLVSSQPAAAQMGKRSGFQTIETPVLRLSNFSTTKFPSYRACVAAIAAGTGRCRVVLIGASNGRGWGAGEGNATFNARRHSWFTKVAALSAARGLPATAEGFCGAGNGSGIIAGYEAALAIGNGWTTTATGRDSMGGKPYRNTTTIANNNVVMTPNIQWDTLEVYDELDPTFGTWKYRKNTGAYSAAISSVGTAALRKTVITNTLGFTSVGISRATGEVNIVCWVPYNSAIKGAEYVNASWPGAGTTAWLTNTSGYSPANSLAALSPNLVLIELGLNDYNAAVSIPTFKANLATMITGAKATGADVMLVIPTPPDLSYGGGAPWQPYVDAEIDVGNTSDVPVIDLGAIFGGYSSSLTIDQVHYLELSNVWKAMAVDRALLMATQ